MIIAKNTTGSTLVIQITGNKTIDIGASSSVNLLETFGRSELFNSTNLINLIKDGSVIINDGDKDQSWIDGIDLIRDYSDKTEKDTLGRWIVRSDSRRIDFDICFCGSGDDLQNGILGGGTPFKWDFSAPPEDPRWNPNPPAGYKQQKIQWQYAEGVHVKEGNMYFLDARKDSYLNFYALCPPGGYYMEKYWDEMNQTITFSDIKQATQFEVVNRWVVNYPIEGSVPMGDELNTESADETLAPYYIVWNVEINAPENAPNLADFHGHFTLEIYRPRTVLWPAP